MDTQAMFARSGLITRLLIWRGIEMGLASMAGFEAQIQQFRQCTVTWEAPSVADAFDLKSTNNRDEGYSNDGGTSTT